VDAEKCPGCGGTGFVTLPIDPHGELEIVAFARFECPSCEGTGRTISSPSDDPKQSSSCARRTGYSEFLVHWGSQSETARSPSDTTLHFLFIVFTPRSSGQW
jgi:DnaJ-class molecular chaperone